MQIEVWKDIKDYQGIYKISNYGKVLNVKTNKLRKLQVHKVKNKHRIYNKCGVCLWKNKKYKNFTLSRLVYETFIGNVPDGFQIDHIDNNPQNNRLDNLQLLTPSENNKKIHVDNPNLRYLKATKIKCLNNGKIYNSQRDASRELNIDYKLINSALKNKNKTAKGFSFVYL